MPDFLNSAFTDGPQIKPLEVFVRLVVALVLGAVVAWIYRRTRRGAEISSSFPVTLVLLSILIAMVTQVIGDNMARAFSLVGALVDRTFSNGGARHAGHGVCDFRRGHRHGCRGARLWVALIGLAVVGFAAYLMMARAKVFSATQPAFVLSVRVGLGHDLEKLLGTTLDQHLQDRELMSVSTAKQGISLDVTYETRLRPDGSADELVKSLNRIEGVQSVEMRRRGFEE